MQLFRKQALDHQNRLHGEIFLVPPLHWQAIGGLLLAVALGCAAILVLGTYSRTVSAPGVIQTPATFGELHEATATPPSAQDSTPWIAVLEVPIAQADEVAPGQSVSLVVDGYPLAEFGSLQGTVANIGSINVAAPSPHRQIIVELSSDAPPSILHDGIKAQARVAIGEQPLWRWLLEPILPVAARS